MDERRGRDAGQDPAAEREPAPAPGTPAPRADDGSGAGESAESLARVRYLFSLVEQPDAKWIVLSVRFDERVSELYRVDVELAHLEGGNTQSLLGQPCTLTMERNDAQRHLHGIVSTLTHAGEPAQAARVRLSFVPALAALEHRTNCRIFGGGAERALTVPDVLQRVLGEALEPYGRKATLKLSRERYPKREYVTQFHESDLTFVMRLMAEEGIWYYFDHESEPDREQLVLVDVNESALEARLVDGSDELPLQLEAASAGYWQTVSEFVRRDSLGATSVSVRAYNWTNPGLDRTPQRAAPIDTRDAPELGVRALYQPDDLTVWGYDSGAKVYRDSDAEEQARIRFQHEATKAAVVHGVGNLVALCPGQKVTVRGHPAGLDGSWLVLSVAGTGSDASWHGEQEETSDFRITFTCLPINVAYRPARVPRPRVHGIQTALVVGPDGKESTTGDDIHTDEHGRIQVKFPWDRTEPGARDATVTCFLRVAQLWGGASFGFMFIPRIGMEVVVSFVDGDPDRPLVTGCVYNGVNQPAHPLPKEKTKSYVRTSSSPGGGGFNELLFEDMKGEEQIYLHAQKDHVEEVEHNHSKSVKADRSVSVGGNESYAVTGNQTLSVDKDRTVTITQNETYTVQGEERLEVTKKTSELYHGGRERSVEKFDNTKVVGANKNTNVEGQYNVEVATHFSVAHEQNQLFLAKKLSGKFEDRIEFKVGGNLISIDSAGTIKLSAEKKLILSCGAASLVLDAAGTIEGSAAKKVALGSGPSAIVAETAGVTVSGPKITSSAIGIHEIGGALIKVG